LDLQVRECPVNRGMRTLYSNQSETTRVQSKASKPSTVQTHFGLQQLAAALNCPTGYDASAAPRCLQSNAPLSLKRHEPAKAGASSRTPKWFARAKLTLMSKDLLALIESKSVLSTEDAATVVRAYSGRAYHNADHILAVLDYAAKRCPEDEELFWAMVFHDIVYIPGGNCNEELSVLRAREFLDLSEPRLQKIDALIMATKTHPTEPWAEWNDAKCAIVDADLMGFVIDWQNNSTKVRQEYRHISDKQFAEGRCSFLLAFKERHPFYCDRETEALFGDVARANIEAEIAMYSVCE
jgi:predicted metal-dependent HD superfamily phosphohydrolase